MRSAAGLALALATSLIVPMTSHSTEGGHSPQYNWTNATIGGGGFVTGVVFNPARPGLAYARTDIGGAYRWDAAARRWTPLMDGTAFGDYNDLGVQSIATDPIDPRRVWVAAGAYAQPWSGDGEILRSDNEGRTWQATRLPIQLASNQDGRGMGERLVVDPNDDNVLYLGTPVNGLWRSTDGGRTWAPVGSFPVTSSPDGIGLPFVTFGPRHGRPGTPTTTVYVGDATATGPNLYASQDAGSTWRPVAGAPAGLLPQHAVRSADNVLYLDYANEAGPNGMTDGAVWSYRPDTGQWLDITPEVPGAQGNPAFGYGGLAVDPRRPDTVMVATNDRWGPVDDIFRTTDGGQHWTSVSATASIDVSSTPFLTFGAATAKFGWWIATVAIDPFDSDHVVYGTGATLFGSQDATRASTHWSSTAVAGIEETAVNDLVSPPTGPCQLVSAIGDLGGFCHTDLNQSPANGMSEPVLGTGTSLAEAGAAADRIVRVGWSGGSYSTDGGVAWTAMALPTGSVNGAGTVGLSADGNAVVWAPQDSAPAYSTDAGQTWTPVTGLPSGLRPVGDPLNPAVFYAVDGATGTIYRSVDAGHTFTAAATGLPIGSGSQLQATPGRAGDVWISVIGGGLFHSVDGGTSFTKLPGVDSSYNIGFGKAAPRGTYPTIFQVAVSGGVGGVYRSTDGGASWLRINDDSHTYGFLGQSITGDPRVFGRVYLATNGRGIVLGQQRNR